MALTLEQMRQRFCEAIEDWLTETTTSAGADSTKVMCTALTPYADDYFNGWWVRITSGDCDGQERQVLDYATAGTLTVSRAFTATIAISVTFELHRRCTAASIMAYLNRAKERMYPYVYTELENYKLITNNLITANGDFETYAAGFTGWTASVITVAEESTIILPKYGSTKAAKLTRAAADGYLYTALANQALLDMYVRGRSPTFLCWAKASTTSQARLAIYDGTTITYGDYHSGDGSWELLDATASIAEDKSAVQLRIYVQNTAGDVYVDEAFCYAGINISEYTTPTAIEDVFDVKMEQGANRERDLPYVPIRYRVDKSTIRLLDPESSGYHLLVYGKAHLADLATDASSWSIDGDEGDIIVSAAVAEYYSTRLAGIPAENVELAQLEYKRWFSLSEQRGLRYGKRRPSSVVRF